MFDRVLNTPPYFDICIVLLNTQKQITHLFIFSNQENNFQLKLDRFFNTSVMCLPSIHGGYLVHIAKLLFSCSRKIPKRRSLKIESFETLDVTSFQKLFIEPISVL